jgi:Arc/MetJ-type ribon-helix-helix transcriptional regulator
MTPRHTPRRGAAALAAKARITIRLDEDVLAWFRSQVGGGGVGYQTLINRALREYIAADREPLEATLRRVIREELARDHPSALMVAEEAEPYGKQLRRPGRKGR